MGRKTDLPEAFVTKIKKQVRKIGITQRQLALQSDLDPATLTRILSGQQKLPSNETILRMASVLDIQPPELLLVEAGRIPRNRSRMIPLMRAVSELSETELQQVLNVANKLAQGRKKRKKKW